MAGGTAEAVGFDPGLTEVARGALAMAAQCLAPRLHGLAPTAHWSGLRPMTPHGEPILGPDPAMPEVVYACGHSRNGVLLAARTGAVLAELIEGESRHPILSLLGPTGASAAA
jgi:glycine oxidase